ncbi:MAG: hypothetical protein ABI206_08680, partial [Antricoccus sp.]
MLVARARWALGEAGIVPAAPVTSPAQAAANFRAEPCRSVVIRPDRGAPHVGLPPAGPQLSSVARILGVRLARG